MAEDSSGRPILGGLVGPKPRPKGVGDGQTVDIPSPRADDQVRSGDGAGQAERGVGDAASNRAGPERSGLRRGKDHGRPWSIRPSPGLQEKPRAGGRARPYRRPTLVAGYENTKGNG